jgi:imidazole glycerol-phosphate synthase subunit HisH
MTRMAGSPSVITIVDYGMGNVRSVEKAFEHVGATVRVVSDGEQMGDATALVLPGVGAFPEAMRRIRERGLDAFITERAEAGAALLGICLGMHLLFESSSEHGGATGLGLLPGHVEVLQAPGLKLPNIGWSPLQLESPSPITDGIAEGEPMYFVHSLAAHPRPGDLMASSEHGERFAAIVGSGRIFGTQFHPEKSSGAGLRMLRNFADVAAPLAAASA